MREYDCIICGEHVVEKQLGTHTDEEGYAKRCPMAIERQPFLQSEHLRDFGWYW